MASNKTKCFAPSNVQQQTSGRTVTFTTDMEAITTTLPYCGIPQPWYILSISGLSCELGFPRWYQEK